MHSLYSINTFSLQSLTFDGCRCKTWLINCGRSDLDAKFQSDPLFPSRNCWLCGDHFEQSQFVSANKTRYRSQFVVSQLSEISVLSAELLACAVFSVFFTCSVNRIILFLKVVSFA